MSSFAGNNVVVIDAIRSESGHATALCAVDRLGLAAAPAFAIMALLTGVLEGRQPDILCAGMQHPALLGGMVPMYLLMSAFHFAPWLKLISRLRNGGQRAAPPFRADNLRGPDAARCKIQPENSERLECWYNNTSTQRHTLNS